MPGPLSATATPDGPDGDGDPAAFRRVFDGVVDEVGERLGQQFRLPPYFRDRSFVPEFELDAALLRRGRMEFDQVFGQPGDIDGNKRCGARLGLRDRQQHVEGVDEFRDFQIGPDQRVR